MKFETASQAAERMGVTVRAVQKWAKEGKLEGAQKVGRDWMIPFGATVVDSIKHIDAFQAKQNSGAAFPMFQLPYFSGDLLENIRSEAHV